jgi:prevent-host-death family protein
MKAWPVQDAKARFSELLNTCLKKGPQLVTRRGEEAAVLVPIEHWHRLSEAKPTLKELLLTDWARTDSLISPRRRYRRRKPPILE